MNKWISVEDALPENNEDVLVTDGEGYAVGYWRENIKAWDSTVFGWLERDHDWWPPCSAPMGKITHWARFQGLEEMNENSSSMP